MPSPTEGVGQFPIYGDKYWSKIGMEEPDFPRYGRTLVAVDPGGVHVGVSVFGYVDGRGWECAWSAEMEPEEFSHWLGMQMYLGRIDILVYESFRLFASKMEEQIGSEMETSQLIGVIKYIWRACKDTNRFGGDTVVLVKQEPKIKKPTAAVLRNRKIQSLAKFQKIPNNHASDAELHGFFHIIKTLEEPVHQDFLDALREKKANAKKR